MLLGAHMSISGGIYNAPERCAETGGSAMQIFTKNNNRWDASPLKDEDIEEFKKNIIKYNVKMTVAHDSYLINLASPDDSTYKKSKDAFMIEMERAERLGIPFLIFHPGNHMESGITSGIDRISDALTFFIEKTKNYKLTLLLETTAGQGTSIGYQFEHLKEIMDKTGSKDRLGVCIDTCHIFAAGYDIRDEEGYKKTFKKAGDIFGINTIKGFHINDSKNKLASKVDRHEHIGKGFLGITPFKLLLNDERFKNVPMILETPKGEDMTEDKMNLAVLKGLVL